MYEEEFYQDNGVAYNSDNFDDDFMSLEVECEGIFEECPLMDHKQCFRWKECREDTL